MLLILPRDTSIYQPQQTNPIQIPPTHDDRNFFQKLFGWNHPAPAPAPAPAPTPPTRPSDVRIRQSRIIVCTGDLRTQSVRINLNHSFNNSLIV